MKNDKSKKYILAIETTSKVCGVAILCDNNIIYESNIDSRLNHSVTLCNNIIDSLKNSHIDLSDIKCIKVSSGPGSFTGIRIGISAALGLSIPYNTKVEYVDTLDIYCNQLNFKNDFIISLIDAKSNRVYMSLYNGKNLTKLISDRVVGVFDLIDMINKHFKNKNAIFALVGDGALSYNEYFKTNLKVNYKICNDSIHNISSRLAATQGKVSKIPILNYVLASKAERELHDKSRTCKK